MSRTIEFKPGDQIAYIPMHADGDINHQDVEFGFVTSVCSDTSALFCRYWSKYSPGELRTKANSESTPIDMLVHHVTVIQSKVDALLEELGYRAKAL